MGKKLSEKDFKRLIQLHIDKKNYVKIFLTEESPEESASGFIVKYSDKYVMIQEIYDFMLVGFRILPYERISSIRYNENEKIYKKIISEEGLLNFNNKVIDTTSLKNAEKLFSSLQDQNFHCIIESASKTHDFFTIGEITKVKEKSVMIHNYDSTGKLDKKPCKIPYKEIEFITFNDNYSTVFRKYIG